LQKHLAKGGKSQRKVDIGEKDIRGGRVCRVFRSPKKKGAWGKTDFGLLGKNRGGVEKKKISWLCKSPARPKCIPIEAGPSQEKGDQATVNHAEKNLGGASDETSTSENTKRK